MVTDNEIRHLTVPNKMFAYANSYLRGSTALCEDLARSSGTTWADGAVVLMMSAHATELFLKGMLLTKLSEEEVWKRGHDLEGLATDYRSAFTTPEFEWAVPFRTEYPEGMTREEIAELRPRRDAPPSILYRYPVDRAGEDWRGLYGFEPNSFIPVLRTMKSDFERLRALAV